MTAIYLDHNATTPLHPEVQEEMALCLGSSFGNPGSIHAAGQEARRIVDRARERVARIIGAQPEEIIFTSGGTEANNLAILGAVTASGREGLRVLTSAIEHPSVLNACRHLEETGFAVRYLPVDGEGLVDPEVVVAAVAEGGAFVSVMLANNEVGTVQPVADLSSRVGAAGAIVHTDAVQAVGKIPVDVGALGVDLLSLSAHKLYGPKGVGALYVRKGTRLSPMFFGGHQERGVRPGTENVPGIAGFGKACELASLGIAEDGARLAELRDRLEALLLARIQGARVNGQGVPRLPNTSNVSFEGLDGQLLAIRLDLLGVEVSTGAACSSADHQASHVLIAMGRTPAQARSSLRFSPGRGTTDEEVDLAVERVCRAVEILRES